MFSPFAWITPYFYLSKSVAVWSVVSVPVPLIVLFSARPCCWPRRVTVPDCRRSRSRSRWMKKCLHFQSPSSEWSFAFAGRRKWTISLFFSSYYDDCFIFFPDSFVQKVFQTPNNVCMYSFNCQIHHFWGG